MKKLSTLVLSLCLIGLPIFAQTTTPTTPATSTGPTYFSTTGVRASYYDQSLTETTNFGVRVTSANVGVAGQTLPTQGLWAVMSIDATPRTQSSTAALRFGARYFLKSVANGNLILYGNLQAGAVTAPAGSASSLLGNLQGGAGVVWRACHTFNKNSTVNCIADLDYELNTVTSQSVKPLVGIYVGLAF
jgi:hypothetical protein